jgi:hypothetical protein
MPNPARGVTLKLPALKAAPKPVAKPSPVAGVSGKVAAPAKVIPQAKPVKQPGPLSPKLPTAPFAGAPKLERAYAQSKPPKPSSSGGLLSDITSPFTAAFHMVYPSASRGKEGGTAATITPSAAQGLLGRKAQAMSLALSQNPIGTARATVSSVPGALNAMLTGTGRLVGETVSGHPGRALSELADSFKKEYDTRYGGLSKPGGIAADAARMEKQGMLPEATDVASVLVPGEAGAGRLLTRGVAKTGFGAEEFAKVAKYREAVTHAYQHADVQNFLRRKDLAKNPVASIPKPTRAERRKAAIYESATQPRPGLRTAPGPETPRIERGAAVTIQPRSPNLFRGMRQTALDNARRRAQQQSLQRVVEARQPLALDRNLHGSAVPAHYASQLAYDTRRGEVTPLIANRTFLGAQRAQRIGTSYLKGKQVRGRRAEGEAIQHDFNQMLQQATPEQQRLLVHAKEGMLPLHDPQKAHEWLKELHAQARAGHVVNGKNMIPWTQQRSGMDVARELAPVLKHIDKNGPESVFTPEFEKLVHAIPDERMTTPRVPGLNPDQIVARRYLPQMQMLDQWAERNPTHPLAGSTKAAVAQVHQLLQAGEDLKNPEHLQAEANLREAQRNVAKTEQVRERAIERVGKARGTQVAAEQERLSRASEQVRAAHIAEREATRALNGTRGAAAQEKFVTAKNLADETARAHELPTDRAYVEHTNMGARDNWVHTLGNRAPSDFKRWQGQLQKMGYRRTDAQLILHGILKNIRYDYNGRFIREWDQRFGIGPRNMTAREAEHFLQRSGRNPNDFVIGHVGKLRESLIDRQNADHLLHLDQTPEDLTRSMDHLINEAGHVNLEDPQKGARIYPKAAWEELRGGIGGGTSLKYASGQGLVGRLEGKAKGLLSKEMLGFFNLPWVATMSALTYPIQGKMGGASLLHFPAAVKWYRGLSEGDKRLFDSQFGVDSPHRTTSHGITPERIGSATPAKFENLSRTLQLVRESPFGQALNKLRPDEALLKVERVPRRYSRIAAGHEGIRREALRNMWRESKGLMREQTKLEELTNRLMRVGRGPSAKYLDEMMKYRPIAERQAQHLDRMMGEWKDMTQFERNVLNRWIMFYPWVRYSMRLVSQTLPAHHPIFSSLALKYGSIQDNYLKELLGTEPPPGNVYLGPAQPNVPPERRQFSVVGIRQANPTLNAALDIITGGPGRIFDTLPPYITAALDWAVGKNLFTDKPFKGSQKGESGGMEAGKRPQILPYMFNETLMQPLAPLRAANELITHGRPQAADSLFGSRPVKYSAGTQAKIEREAKGRTDIGELLKRELPFIPHSDQGQLAGIIRAREKQAKEQRKRERKSGTAAPPPPPPPPAAPPPPPPPPP